MPDPADKSDDLIAELAKLMATTPGNKPAPAPVPSAAVPRMPAPMPGNPAPAPAPTVAPTPFRIPGMDAAPRPVVAPVAPVAAAPVQAPAPQPEQRAPVTGSIRIPGMDQPAPVSTSAPVSKFDFGKPVPAAAPIRQEPIASLSERIAAQQAAAPAPAASNANPAGIRIPSGLAPVSENRSFAEGPALTVAKPAPAPVPQAPAPVQSAPQTPAGGDFHFDFGFKENPPPSPGPIRPLPNEEPDPIAALIEAEMDDRHESEAEAFHEPEEHHEPVAEAPRAAPVVPLIRTNGAPQPSKPVIAPAVLMQQQKPASTPIPLKPVSVAPRAPETDRFAISPGVGLNMKPPANQPLGAPVARAPQQPAHVEDSDPMSEIESLIGEAVRVELSPGPVRVQAAASVAPRVELEPEADLEREIGHRQEPAPVVPPLTTQFAPRRTNIKDDAGSNSAEDAILAAAAASGAEVGRIDPALGDESPYRRLKVKPQRASFLSGGMRQYVGIAVAGTLLLAAGLGLYWVLNMGRASNTNGANAPQLTASATPVKVKPAATTKPETDTAKSPVLAKMDGASSAPSTEQLVSTDETNGGATVARDVTQVEGTGDSENGLANRKVRTVTVRPDGTIVSGDDAVAGGEEMPVDRPNVPDVPSTETTNLLGNDDTQVAAADPATDSTAAAPSTAADATQVAVIDPTAVAPTPMTLPARSASASTTAAAPLALTATPKNTSVNAVVGAQTPNGQIDLLGGDTTPAPAKTTPKPTTTASAAPLDAGSAPAYVQISSQPTQADAQAAVKSQTAKYGSLFGGNKLVIQQADLGQKGIKYRVRLPVGSLGEANDICSQIKAQGGDCFPTKG